jgi:rhomboid protease GluP
LTLLLVLANLMMAFAQFATSGFVVQGSNISTDPIDWALGAKVPSLIAHGEYWRLVSAGFLHGTWAHLAWNMVGLLTLGRLIEAFYGPARMLVIFVISCATGFVASYLFTPSVSLGASTGILGLMGALLLHNRKYRVHLPERLNRIYPFLVLVVVIQFVLDAANHQVDVWGHVGGFIGGVVMAALLESRMLGEDQEARDWLPLPTAVATAVGLLSYATVGLLLSLPHQWDLIRLGRARRPWDQVRVLDRIVQERPYFAEARLSYAMVLLLQRRTDDAAVQYDAAIHSQPSFRKQPQADIISETLAAHLLALGQTQFAQNRWEASIGSYRRALVYTNDPTLLGQAHNGIAWTLAEKLNHGFDQAERHALLGVRAQPLESAIIDTLAWVYFKQERYTEALQQQLRAVQLEERSGSMQFGLAEMYYHLGAIYEKLGRRDEALSSYARALRMNPRYAEATEGVRRLSGAQSGPARDTDDPRTDPAVQHGLI